MFVISQVKIKREKSVPFKVFKMNIDLCDYKMILNSVNGIHVCEFMNIQSKYGFAWLYYIELFESLLSWRSVLCL